MASRDLGAAERWQPGGGQHPLVGLGMPCVPLVQARHLRDLVCEDLPWTLDLVPCSRLSLLNEIASRLVLGSASSVDLLGGIFAALGRQIGIEMFFNFRADPAGQLLHLASWGGIDEATRARYQTMRYGQLLCGTVAQTARPLVVEDMPHADEPQASELRAAGIMAYAGFPLVSGGRLLGTIAFATRRRTHFAPDALNLIRTVSDLVAAALAREVLEEELRASESRFRAVFENAGIGLGQASADRGFFESNDAFCRIIGYSHEELAARHWTDYTHPDDIAADLALDARLRAGEIPSYILEKRYIHKGGHVVWARLSLSAVRDGAGRLTHEIAMVEDISERKAAEAALRFAMEEALEAARTDSLTGLPNRTAFNEALTKPARTGERGIIFIDVDGFKRINDSLGHATGDDLIRRLAARLNVFAGPDCVLARIGGDEFVFLVTGPDAGERARELSAGVSRAARSPLHLACCPIQVRLAIGYAVQSDDFMDAETLLRHADLAMYEAKGRRTGEPVAFDALIERSTSEATQIERELRRALGRPDEIHLVYQPIVGPDGRLSHAEALARWTSPRLGEVPPDRFIAVAERSGLMVELGSKLFALICKDLVRVPSLRVSVNVSSIQLMAPNFLQDVLEEVLARGLDPSRIEIELTESVLVEDAALAEQRIVEMRKAGFSVALDDFGTGFSSLGYLHRMSFDRLKIDRSFVTGFSAEPKRIALLSSLIVMAHAMDLRVVCEGVETAQDAQMLQAFGCDFLQGFWVGRPGTLGEVAVAWLSEA